MHTVSLKYILTSDMIADCVTDERLQPQHKGSQPHLPVTAVYVYTCMTLIYQAYTRLL